MEQVRKLEAVVSRWYKQAPHLPANGQKWLAENAWWIVLVGVILGALGVFGLISATFLASAILVSIGGAVGAAIGGIALLAVVASLIFSIVSLIILIAAIAPLKAGHKKGWNLMFLAVLVNVLALVIHFLFSFDVFGLIWGALMTAVGTYFLFEIRSHFISAKPVRKTVTEAKIVATK